MLPQHLSTSPFLRYFVLILFTIFFYSFSHAAVNIEHPRIWIDGPSGKIMTRLKTAKNANSPEWVALKLWCDTYLGQNLAGGQYGDWQKGLLNYALAFQVSGNDSYGKEGVKYLTALLRDKNSIGDGLGGTTNIQTDSGWVARTIGVGVPIGRDWLNGCTALTPALIDECATRLGEWITWFNSFGYSRIDPLDNYYAGYFGMVYCAAIGLAGDPKYQATWLEQSETMWSNYVLPTINGLLAGGDWYEGWNYGNQASRLYISYPHALQTGTSNNTHWNDTNWASELIRSHIHMLYPSRGYISDDGSWSGSYKGNPFRDLMMLLSTLNGYGGISTELAGTAKWFANNITWEPIPPDKWELMLWTDSTVSQVVPSPSLMGGLTYHMAGGHVVTRSEPWIDLNATFLTVIARGLGSSDAEGSENAGELKIASRGSALLVDGSTYEQPSEFRNVPRISGAHVYAPYQEWWHDNVKVTSEDNTDCVLINVNRLDEAYDRGSQSAVFYTRTILFIRPDYVVTFDNLRTSAYPTNQATYQWYVPGTPTISNGYFTVTSGNARLFTTVLAPAPFITNNSNTGSRKAVCRVDVTTGSTTTDQRLITVFETASSTKPSPDSVTKISAQDLLGATISGVATDSVVLFNSHNNQSDISFPLSYSINNSHPSKHIIIGLSPNVQYTISNGTTKIDAWTTPLGVLRFSSTTKGPTQYLINQSQSNISPPSGIRLNSSNQ